ncbi:MAG: hypothetical protein ACI4LO_09645 [Anaerovoracaceae bacterium]
MRKFEFSKLIILMETMAVYFSTYKTLNFVELCITYGYTGSLPFLTTLITAIWAAYGTSVSFYYNKSKAENTIGGIKYDAAMGSMETRDY